MQPYPIELKGDMFFCDNSSLSNITACPRKGAMSVLLKRREVKPRAALFFGGAMHKALETRDLLQEPMVTGAIEEQMVDSLVTYYEDWNDDMDYRNLSYAIRTTEDYNKAWKFDPHNAITLPEGQVAVELPVAIILGRIRIDRKLWVSDPDINSGEAQFRHIDYITVVFTGKLDRICQHQGNICVLDHKTTSMGGPTFFDEFYTSHQFRGYMFAAQKILGKKLAGVLINALICRPPKKDGDVNFTFDRQFIPINQEHLEEWKLCFLRIVSQFINQAALQGELKPNEVGGYEQAFPMYTTSCVTKYGKCEFHQVCQLPPSHRASMLHSGLFEENTWSPIDEGERPKEKTTNTNYDLPGFFKP